MCVPYCNLIVLIEQPAFRWGCVQYFFNTHISITDNGNGKTALSRGIGERWLKQTDMKISCTLQIFVTKKNHSGAVSPVSMSPVINREWICNNLLLKNEEVKKLALAGDRNESFAAQGTGRVEAYFLNHWFSEDLTVRIVGEWVNLIFRNSCGWIRPFQ